jgi:DNA-binding NarL/FixJ family response regulator
MRHLVSDGDSISEGRRKLSSMARVILVCAPPTALFQGLLIALKSRLPSYTIYLINDISAVPAITGRVSLVLAYAEPGAAIRRAVACRNALPEASLGLMVDTIAEAEAADLEIDMAQGILPLSLALDVWLAAITVLLHGGTYHPAPPPAQPRNAGTHLGLGRNKRLVGPGGECLTRREQQVLVLLSEGLQNKHIADRMALSEHTVKVHVHNLIAKLRVNNRTHAAAFYRSSMRTEQPEPRVEPSPIL